MIKRISDSIRDLREYGASVYYGVSTNGLGGVIFGLLSGYFNPRVPMPPTLPQVLMRILFGAGAGVAYSLGAFIFTMPYLESLANFINKHVKSEAGRDLIYSFLSIGTSLAVLVIFAYFLFSVHRGRIPVFPGRIPVFPFSPTPVTHKYLVFQWFVSSLTLTNWTEIALIPLSGTLLKELLRVLRRILQPFFR
ncbi:MAG: hypothetical protein ACE5NN_06680 [Candidatus Bathyarchaeia archaeon]